MSPRPTWQIVLGWILHLAVAGMLLPAAIMKLSAHPDVLKGMAGTGLEGKHLLLGGGELAAVILLLLPWTAPFGTLFMSGFWGGTIAVHMSNPDPKMNDYTVQASLLLATWIGAYLRGAVEFLDVGRRQPPPAT